MHTHPAVGIDGKQRIAKSCRCILGIADFLLIIRRISQIHGAGSIQHQHFIQRSKGIFHHLKYAGIFRRRCVYHFAHAVRCIIHRFCGHFFRLVLSIGRQGTAHHDDQQKKAQHSFHVIMPPNIQGPSITVIAYFYFFHVIPWKQFQCAKRKRWLLNAAILFSYYFWNSLGRKL